MNQSARIENWRVLLSPEGLRLAGFVYGHPGFRDGEHIITSPLRYISRMWAQTLNTCYFLGCEFEEAVCLV